MNSRPRLPFRLLRLPLLALLAMYGCATATNDGTDDTTDDATDDIRMVGLVFDEGAPSTEIADEITGAESVMYRFRGEVGQRIEVLLRPEDRNTEFLLYAPGEWPGEEMHNSRTSGSREYRGELYRDGMHAVQVYRTGPTSGAEETSRFQLVITKR